MCYTAPQEFMAMPVVHPATCTDRVSLCGGRGRLPILSGNLHPATFKITVGHRCTDIRRRRRNLQAMCRVCSVLRRKESRQVARHSINGGLRMSTKESQKPATTCATLAREHTRCRHARLRTRTVTRSASLRSAPLFSAVCVCVCVYVFF